MRMRVERLDRVELERRGVFRWPVWTKEVSTFPWSYDSREDCYILEGRVTVTDAQGQSLSFGPGDFVSFEAGLSCTWEVHEAVRKHYDFP